MPSLSVSAVIAAKHEARSIGSVIFPLKKFCSEIIVVCDSAEDPTLAAARELGAKGILNDLGPGRGRAIQKGIQVAAGQIIVLMDADGSHDGSKLADFIGPIERGEADLVIGSRIRGGSEEFSTSAQDKIQHLGNRAATGLVNLLLGSKFTDLHYGQRAVRADLLKSLHLEDTAMTTEAEVLIKCWKRRARILEIPAFELKRQYGKSHLRFPGIIWDCFRSYLKHGFSPVPSPIGRGQGEGKPNPSS